MMKKNILRTCFLLLCAIFTFSVSAKQAGPLSDNAILSLLTCSPGNELYSVFGHSAIRIQDKTNNVDVVFNFGTFDFNESNFYYKFAKGKLKYFLSVEQYNDFVLSYVYEGRGITEQVLAVPAKEVNLILIRLMQIYTSQERFYTYDFLYNNCSTKIWEVLCNNLDVHMPTKDSTIVTFRGMLSPYLANHIWAEFGIDILFGLSADKRVSIVESMFLPDYLMSNIDKASIASRPLVKVKQNILMNTQEHCSGVFLSPFAVFMIVLIIILILQQFNFTKTLYVFDKVFIIAAVLVSVLILFMWFFTDHYATKWNINLLWLLLLAFLLFMKGRFLHMKNILLIVLLTVFAAIVLLSIFGFFNVACIPLYMIGFARIMHMNGIYFHYKTE